MLVLLSGAMRLCTPRGVCMRCVLQAGLHTSYHVVGGQVRGGMTVFKVLSKAWPMLIRDLWWLQLIDKWRASKVTEDAKVGKSMGREDNERVIAQLLYGGYLQFDFSYTAYATNAYLKASQRASLILQGEQIAC